MSRGAPREAARAFGEAVRWSPRTEQMWLFQAQALCSAGDLAGAAEVCRRGIGIVESAERLRALLETLSAHP